MSKFRTPIPLVQVEFFKRLRELRGQVLSEALTSTVKQADTRSLDNDLHTLVEENRLKTVRSFGLTGEMVFVTPYLLKLRPQLLGYYRLLLGFSQKYFYGPGGFGVFSSMEMRNEISLKQTRLLPDLCKAINEATWQLVVGIDEHLTTEHIKELTLMALGAQLRGSYNTVIGANAERGVFDIIKLILAPRNPIINKKTITLAAKNGRSVVIEFGNDPDVRIHETVLLGNPKKLLAIEIKGGTDVSNLHNRLGEAEKSHLKAKSQGYPQCWTLVHFKGFNLERAMTESPSTDRFFDMAEIAEPTSEQGRKFQEELKAIIGLEQAT